LRYRGGGRNSSCSATIVGYKGYFFMHRISSAPILQAKRLQYPLYLYHATTTIIVALFRWKKKKKKKIRERVKW